MKKTFFYTLAVLAGLACTGFAADEAKAEEAEDGIGPQMTLEDWDWIERDISIQVGKELDERVPRYAKGDNVVWTTLGGVVVKGAYEWASSNYVIVVSEDFGKKTDTKIPFEKLGYTERMRCDFNFRNEWTALQARIQTRNTLIENGVHLPGMPDPKKRKTRTRFVAKPDPLENFEELFDSADPRAHYEMGERFMKGINVDQDPAYAAMYFREASSQGNIHAMYNLGVLYFKGVGIARNPGVAYGLITTASEKGHTTAKEFLNKAKVSLAKQREAQKRYAEQAAEYARKSSEYASRYNRIVQSQSNMRQRSEKRFDGRILRRTEVSNSNRNRNRRR